MNTPRTKPPKRYKPTVPDLPDSDYDNRISNHGILSMVGAFITMWPHTEEMMVPVFAALTGIKNDGTARLIFRCIVSHKARVDIMRAVLERTPRHQSTSDIFDKIIDEFHGLAQIRHDYAHGLWRTHKADKKVYLEQETRTYDSFVDKRE